MVEILSFCKPGMGCIYSNFLVWYSRFHALYRRNRAVFAPVLVEILQSSICFLARLQNALQFFSDFRSSFTAHTVNSLASSIFISLCTANSPWELLFPQDLNSEYEFPTFNFMLEILFADFFHYSNFSFSGGVIDLATIKCSAISKRFTIILKHFPDLFCP